MTLPEINNLGRLPMFACCPASGTSEGLLMRARYGVAAVLCGIATGACNAPSQRTDLRPEGPPDVLAVLVMNDGAGGLYEKATFCRDGDNKRPSLVGLPDGTTQQVCPDDGSEVRAGVDDALPGGWYVRIMFDELLDPSIEDLTEIIDSEGEPTGTFEGSITRTHPVALRCAGASGAMVDVPYDGYYSPSGNNVTWPLGPSLVIKPTQPSTIPTNATCEVTLNDAVRDKDQSTQVPNDQRGPYAFSVAPIRVVSISPVDGDELDGVDAGMNVVFNTLIDAASLDDAVTWSFDPGLETTPMVAALVAPIGAGTTTLNIDLGAAPANGYFDANANAAAFGCDTNVVRVCNVSLAPCSTTVPCGPGDQCGKTKSADCNTTLRIDDEQLELTHVDFLASTMTVTRGVNATTAAPHAINSALLTAVNHTASSGHGANGAPAGAIVGGVPVAAAEFFVAGDFKSATQYTWTIPEGTVIKDRCGAATTFGAPSVDDNTQAQFTVKELAFTGITPTDGAMAAEPGAKIQLKFNQPVSPDSLAGRCSTSVRMQCFADDNCPNTETCQGAKFTLTPPIAKPRVRQDPADPSKLVIYGNYQLGTQYVFGIPAGTKLLECPGGETSKFANGCDARDVKDLTVDIDQSVTFTTAAEIELTGVVPEDNATIVKPATVGPAAQTPVRLTFNQEIDPSTLANGPTGFELSPNVAVSVGADPGNFRNLLIRPTANTGFAAGTYTFTIHAGATVKDFLGNTYTQPSDLEIHFTIADSEPAPSCIP